MNYPIQSLAIIAPIVFLVLMIGFPIIGVFAGWKRAAYWGGGTFFFFLVGLIIWSTAGASIVSSFKPLIVSLLEKIKQGITITDSLIVSVAAPIFFILVMMIAELILLINYYAWFKRVAKIKQDIKAKKEYKTAKKAAKEAGKSVEAVKTPKGIQGWTAMQFTTKGKAINMACGAAGMALLFAPSTISFTQAVFFATTSPTTRANNSFANNLFNSLNGTEQVFSWMSYYGGGKTSSAFGSLFSILETYSSKSTYVDDSGNVVEGYKVVVEGVGGETTTTVKQGSTIEALSDITSSGFNELMKKATTITEPTQQTKSVVNTVNQFADSWNSLMKANDTAINAIFNSTDVVTVLKDTLIPSGSEIQLTEETYDDFFGEGSTFEQMLDCYAKGEIEVAGETLKISQLQTIPVSEESFNSICDSLKTSLINDSGLTDKQKQDFDTKFPQIISLIFQKC